MAQIDVNGLVNDLGTQIGGLQVQLSVAKAQAAADLAEKDAVIADLQRQLDEAKSAPKAVDADVVVPDGGGKR